MILSQVGTWLLQQNITFRPVIFYLEGPWNAAPPHWGQSLFKVAFVWMCYSLQYTSASDCLFCKSWVRSWESCVLSKRFTVHNLIETKLNFFQSVCFHLYRDVTAGATGATVIAPKFSDTITLFQPGGADSTPASQRLHQKFPWLHLCLRISRGT